MITIPVKPVPESVYEKLGFYWYRSPDDSYYVADELVKVGESEADAYYAAAAELYDMYVKAGQHVIDKRLYQLLDIPPEMIKLIEESWEDDRNFHLVGRFDLAGGLDGLPIKLIEFNADTPSLIFEVALIQWMLLRHNNLPEEKQYNSLYETLKESFSRMRKLHPGFAGSEAIPHALFSCFDSWIEDENTTRLMEEIAYESGWITGFEYVDKVFFSAENGIGTSSSGSFDYWFKLIPYEFFWREEPELLAMLSSLSAGGKAVLLNPPYSILFQSKGIMKVLWDLFPGHPLLLETDFGPLRGKKCVEKKSLGREGASITIRDKEGNKISETSGEYDIFRSVFQEFAELPSDAGGYLYQAGVFFSYEPCGLGFRREKGIITNHSQFAGHIIG
ncbi:MAG: glutathionylspermidine synthase family protein [Syntrophaceae bacterium]